jgi:hypothetical protein
MDPGIDATAPVEPAGPCAAAASTKPNAKTRPNAKRNHMLSSEGSRHCWKTVSPACGGAYAKSAELSRAVLPHGEIAFAQAIEPLLIQAESKPSAICVIINTLIRGDSGAKVQLRFRVDHIAYSAFAIRKLSPPDARRCKISYPTK